jgi:hypothetical protein
MGCGMALTTSTCILCGHEHEAPAPVATIILDPISSVIGQTATVTIIDDVIVAAEPAPDMDTGVSIPGVNAPSIFDAPPPKAKEEGDEEDDDDDASYGSGGSLGSGPVTATPVPLPAPTGHVGHALEFTGKTHNDYQFQAGNHQCWITVDKVMINIRHDLTGLFIEVVPSDNPDDWPLGKIELPGDKVWTVATAPASAPVGGSGGSAF